MESLLYQRSLKQVIQFYSTQFKLPFELVSAIVYHESVKATKGRDPLKARYAIRSEENFYTKYLKLRPWAMLTGYKPTPLPSKATEKFNRAQSWGYMQLMGETLRMMGWDGQWWPEVCEPHINIKYGCKYLAHLFERHDHLEGEAKLNAVLKSYNGSSAYIPLIRNVMASKEYEAMFV